MIEDLPDILHRLISQKDHLQVRFPEPDISVPVLAPQRAVSASGNSAGGPAQ